MANALTVKGQVTIPKLVRDSMGLKPGDAVDFVVNDRGETVLRRAGPPRAKDPQGNRFERARGTIPIPLGCSVDEYMRMIRGRD